LIALGGGCNPLMLPFLFNSQDPMTPAELQNLVSEDKKKEVKVLILSYMGLETRAEFLNADKEVARYLANSLDKLTKDKESKVTIINPNKVEEYMREN